MIRLRQFAIFSMILFACHAARAGEIVTHNGTNDVNATVGTGIVDISLDNDFTYSFSLGNLDGARLTKTFDELGVHTMEVLTSQHITLQGNLFIPPESPPAQGFDATFEQIFNNSTHAWESYHLSWSGPAPVSNYGGAAAFGPPAAQELDGNTFNIVFDAPLEIGGFFYVQLNFLIDPFLVGEIPDGEYGFDDGIPDGLVWDYRWTLTQYAVPHAPDELPPDPVPEPSTLGMCLLGAIGLLNHRCRRR